MPCDVSLGPGSAKKEPYVAMHSGTESPLLDRFARLGCDIESDSLAGLLLRYRGSRHDGLSVNHVARSHLHQINRLSAYCR